MSNQEQKQRLNYEFWREVREKLLLREAVDIDAAIDHHMDFLTEKKIPWDLVYHQGADDVVASILATEAVTPVHP